MKSCISKIIVAIILPLAASLSWGQQVGSPEQTVTQPPLKEVQEISNLQIIRQADGRWIASFDVDFMSLPKVAEVQIAAFTGPNASESDTPFRLGNKIVSRSILAQPKTIHLDLELEFPTWVKNPGDRGENNTVVQNGTVTDKVVVRLVRNNTFNERVILAKKVVDQVINWPSYSTWETDRKIGSEGSVAVLNRAIELIDAGNEISLYEAKIKLERLLSKDDKLVQAYIELARVAMKTTGGLEGLRHAEILLNSAIKIEPNSADAKILRGYVYSHQDRHALAELDFSQAAKSNPKNVWLWSNWGESLTKQKKYEAAVSMYRKAVDSPVSNESYDRARVDAYDRLIGLYNHNYDIQAIDAIHQQRLKDYGVKTCYAADYALFKLQNYADAEGAIELTSAIANVSCDNLLPKEVLGMAYYVKWSKMTSGDRESALRNARISFPSGARLFYLLGGSDKTLDTAKQLAKIGEVVDQSDNRKMTALAYAVNAKQADTALRLLQIGARPTVTVGHDEVPIALLPIFTDDLTMIELMRKFGVDYATLSYRGNTAREYALARGNRKLIEALSNKGPKT